MTFKRVDICHRMLQMLYSIPLTLIFKVKRYAFGKKCAVSDVPSRYASTLMDPTVELLLFVQWELYKCYLTYYYMHTGLSILDVMLLFDVVTERSLEQSGKEKSGRSRVSSVVVTLYMSKVSNKASKIIYIAPAKPMGIDVFLESSLMSKYRDDQSKVRGQVRV